MYNAAKRGLRIEDDGALFGPDKLAAFLKTLHNTPQIKQLERLVRDMNYISAFVRSAGNPRGNFLWMGALGGRRTPKELLDRLSRSRDFFAKLHISLVPFQPDQHGWIASYATPSVSINAMAIVRTIGFLIWKAASDGTLRRVRECCRCNSWYAARRDDQKFCSSPCREKFFRTSDAGRAKRATYMRRYRANEKRANREYQRIAKK